MGIGGNDFSVNVIENALVYAEEPWNDHWVPFTNFDLLVPPVNAGSIFFYKEPSQSAETIVDSLKASLSKALSIFPPLSGKIEWNEDAGENQFHCNNQGVEFFVADADVQLKELNFYNPDECVEGKLMPRTKRGIIAIQVTKLSCGGIVVGFACDHRLLDGYSANMFISSWADLTRTKTTSARPSFGNSYLKPRSPTTYSPIIDDVFALFPPPPEETNDEEDNEYLIVSRVYYVKGEQLTKLQMLASENGCKRSKVVAFTSFLWKQVALSAGESGKHSEDACNVVVAVDGRRRLSEGGDDDKLGKVMASHFGNVLSMPFGSKKPQELKEMPLTDVATEVYEFLQTATTKEHFLDIIDWVEEQKPQPLISKAFVYEGMHFTMSAGQRFETMDAIDFGWGKVTLGTCHVPSDRKDSFVMTMGSTMNNEDWVVFMHMPKKHLNYIETQAGQVFNPMSADYLKI